MKFRAFVAIDLSEEVKAGLMAVQDLLRPACERVRWVGQAQLHLTLKFCGDIDEREIMSVTGVIRDIYEGSGATHMRVAGLGTFPNIEKNPRAAPKVIWAGVECAKEFLALYNRFEIALMNEVGIRPEPKRYIPHVTLGRVKTTKNLDNLKQEIYKYTERGFGECTGRQIVLYESKLARKGPIYTPLSTVKF
ncbi:RNA 2',3'-cyclic phosphodiesterase [Planctomycetota bacterium]